MRQKIVLLIPEAGSLFESSTPIGVWGSGRAPSDDFDVDFVACSLHGGGANLENGFGLSGLEPLGDHVADADMIVIPTWPIQEREIPWQLIETLRTAHQRGARIVGLCLGAFVVAATGLLDGQSAVTHWKFRDDFQRRYPDVRFEPNTLYVDHDSIVTSAGSAAAVDCCLHLVRRDHGAEVAATIARSLVTAPHRGGTQSQFASAPPILRGDDPLTRALALATERIGTISGVAALADLAGTSRRSFERHLNARLGTTPREWLDEQRVITACRLLETTNLSVEQIATTAGYGSTPTLRRALQRNRGVTPSAYRSMFGYLDSGPGMMDDEKKENGT